MSRLGAFLVQEGILTVADRQVIKRESAAYHGSFARSVLAMGLLDEDELSALLTAKTGCQQVAKDILQELDPVVGTMIPIHVLTWLEVLPLSVSDGLLRLAMVDTTDQDAINQIKFFTGLRVKPMIAKLSEIHRGLRQIGAPLDLGESGFEGLLRTLGRPPLESAIVKPKPNLKPKTMVAAALSYIQPEHAAPVQAAAAPAAAPEIIGDHLTDESSAGSALDEVVDETNNSLQENRSIQLTAEVSEPSESESEFLEATDKGLHRVDEAVIADIAQENFEASQAPADLGLKPEASGESSDISLAAEDEILDAEEQSIDELVGLDAKTEDAESFTEDDSIDSPPAQEIQTGGSEPDCTDLGVAKVDHQPMIEEVINTESSEPKLDFFDSSDVSIEVASHSGIAYLNRVLISLQMTTDTSKAFTKVADVASKVGIIEGAIMILRGKDVVPGVKWSKNGSQSESVRELPAGHTDDSIKKLADVNEADVWFACADSLSGQITHGLIIRHHNETVVCIAAFIGSADHEGLRQAFGDVIRAVPVKG